MHEYRVTKYDPQFRVNGAYTREEWTSFSDVGRSFGGKAFTMDDYRLAEQRHIDFLCTLAERESAFPLQIEGYESYVTPDLWQEGQLVDHATLPDLLRDVLQNRCWCRLTAHDFFIHFGWDYYMYVGCSHTQEAIMQLAQAYALFPEQMRSPYHPDTEEDSIPVDLRPMTAIYLTRGEKILLLYRIGSRVVGNSFTGTAGGHMEPEEYNSARACVLRELREETGLIPADLEGLAMRYVTMRLKGGEIRQNYYFFASLHDGAEITASNEGRLEWHDLDALADLPMPHTAKQVLLHYAREGRHNDLLYGAVSQSDGAMFVPLTEF